MLVDAPRPGGGRTRNVRNPILLDHDGPTIDRPPPMLGEHSREILEQAGFSGAEIDRLMREGVTSAYAKAASAA
jgi:crotonobetainyl-CoA:carnitine CoA-transferase CaiB-like acyl-CoA transferase